MSSTKYHPKRKAPTETQNKSPRKTTKRGTSAEKEIQKNFLEDEGTIDGLNDSELDNEPDGEAKTLALLQGFESSSDGSASDDENGDDSEDSATAAALRDDPQSGTTLEAGTESTKQKEGSRVIYLGHIPHGFYEQQMRAYFSQFGDVTRLRLSRNKRTGASKHYAFIEFASSEAAKWAASTMNNYLLFNHILKAKVIPNENLHPELFKGANKRFKKVPWNRLEAFQLKTADRDGWKRRVEAEEKRRRGKAQKLKELGYDFEPAPLRSVESVPVKASETPVEQKENLEKPSDTMHNT